MDKALVVAICHGFHSDPFTCSAHADWTEIVFDDPESCRDFICKAQNLQRHIVDEVLVIGTNTDGDPEVIKHHGEKLAEIDPDTDLPVEDDEVEEIDPNVVDHDSDDDLDDEGEVIK